MTKKEVTEETVPEVKAEVVPNPDIHKTPAPPFDWEKLLIKMQGGKMYLPAAARIKWFRHVHPDWLIHTEIVPSPEGCIVFKAEIINNLTGLTVATAHKLMGTKEKEFLVKAETGAVSRALSMCGFATPDDSDLEDDSNKYREGSEEEEKEVSKGGWA